MEKLPFKVSARTAKLIGQENFSNPEGATIELVKNGYDADAKNCLVVFDILFDSIPEKLTAQDFKKYSSKNEIVNSFYKLKKGEHSLLPNLNEKKINEIKEFFFSQNSIYIIDNGEGMTKETIQNQWMEIGTGNKEINFISDDGRVKTGAKGIGRFALDRLGFHSEMWTYPKGKNIKHGFHWKMDWKQFETPNQSISDIKAELAEKEFNLKSLITEKFKNSPRVIAFIKDKSFSNGTIIKISNLKDNWSEDNLLSVYKSLEALIPPKELAIPFNVNFYHLQNTKLYGEVETAFFNDYDYKVFAEYKVSDLSVKLTITRNELDLKKVKKEFPHIFKNAKSPYDLKTLEAKKFTLTKTANELLKWEENSNNEMALKKVGSFSFSFYFLKNQTSQKENYPLKDINASERRTILERFGGIKIYRDSFRVRPYGDSGNDWLKLGERAAQSPAGAGQRIGDWRVRPNQIAGLINISRIENSNLIDKSDRGALVENETFDVLQKIITEIINVFEFDRTKILNPFYIEAKAREELQHKKEIRVEAEKLADKIVKERIKVEENLYGRKPDLFREKKSKEEKKSYEKIIEKSFEKLEKKEDDDAEIAQVRTLASLGLIVSSFAHELKEVRNNSDDIEDLEGIYTKIVPDDKKKLVEFKDGINIIESLKRDNQKIAHWVDYSLTAIKKDKRKRSSLKFDKYFHNLNKEWANVLESRNIEMKIKYNISRPYLFRAFEMDMNTIFSNLIANSIDAFYNLKQLRDRQISIAVSLIKNQIQITYSDTGTGIPKVFQKNKEDIFLPFTTSKKDKDGNDIGTGLGMYLVKNVVTDNNGLVDLIDSKIGFKLKIEFPTVNK